MYVLYSKKATKYFTKTLFMIPEIGLLKTYNAFILSFTNVIDNNYCRLYVAILLSQSNDFPSIF